MNLKSLAQMMDADYFGDDVPFTGASIDSRDVKPGDLFVCIKGPNFDGHAFATEALAKGAAALMVEKPLCLGLPEVVVNDTTQALGQMASCYRQQFNIPVIALTGSCGKTSTKEMIKAICDQMGPTLATSGNYNNQYGLPLTLLSLKPKHQYAVIEMGASEKGDIEYLAKITRPTISLITNIRDQHVEGLGGRDGISEEKSNIYQYLTQDGIAVVNIDEPYATTWEAKIGEHQRINFSTKGPANINAAQISFSGAGAAFDCYTPMGQEHIEVPLISLHSVENATAAISACMACGATLSDIKNGLRSLKPVKGRMVPHHLENNITLIDDTYNASPASVESAMQTLATLGGKKIFVMSNMGELAQQNEFYHRQLGQWVIENGIDHLLLTGNEDDLQFTLDECDERAEFFASKELLIATLKSYLEPDTNVLIKGSRANQMELIVQPLMTETIC